MRIMLGTSVSRLEESSATDELVDAVCDELGLDARNSLSREIVALEVIECTRLGCNPERICEMVVKELKGPPRAA